MEFKKVVMQKRLKIKLYGSQMRCRT